MKFDKKKTIVGSVIAVVSVVIFWSVYINSGSGTSGGGGGGTNDGGTTPKRNEPIKKVRKDPVGPVIFVKETEIDYLLVKSSSTWKTFAEKLEEGSDDFVEEFTNLFNDLNWTGVFFECKPFKASAAGTELVEFRLLKTDAFDTKIQDEITYAKYFTDQCKAGIDGAAVFVNIPIGDSTLVSPCPAKHLNAAHVKVFMKTATSGQRKVLLQNIGKVLLEKIDNGGDKGIWLSTSGTGVSWLHVRFDPRAKYYTTQEYRSI